MEITKDILLRGPIWAKAIDELSPIFKGTKNRANYNVFMMSLSIGVMYDKRLPRDESDKTEPRNVPRNVLQNNDNGRLDYIFQAAVLSTTTQPFTEEERLECAFGDTSTIDKIDFLTEFANYGVTILAELVGDTVLESMENIKNFVAASVEGRNFDIDALPDDILVET